MCKAEPEINVVGVTDPEVALMEQQTQTLDKQIRMLDSQLAQMEKSRGEMQDFINAFDAGEFKSTTMRQFALAERQMGLQEKALDYLTADVGREPTELQETVGDLSMMQAARLERAYKGNLPVSEGTQRQYEDEKAQLKERLSRKLGPDWETSTAGIQSMNNFEERWSSVMDAERRGEISTGMNYMLQSLGLEAAIAEQNRQLPYASLSTMTTPSGLMENYLKAVETKGTYGYDTANVSYGIMYPGYTSAIAPSQFNRQMLYVPQVASANVDIAKMGQVTQGWLGGMEMGSEIAGSIIGAKMGGGMGK